MMDMASMETASDSLKSSLQVQGTIAAINLKAWQSYDASAPGNSAEVRIELYENLVQSINTLKGIANEIERKDEDTATELDSLNLGECIDSIAQMNKIALKLSLQKTAYSSAQRRTIDKNAKLCSHEYGVVVHKFRAMAASFSKEDYKQYDSDCALNNNRGGQLTPRHREEISHSVIIMPNPTSGYFEIIAPNAKAINAVAIYTADGNKMYEKMNINESKCLINEALPSGVYIIEIIFESESITKRVIIY